VTYSNNLELSVAGVRLHFVNEQNWAPFGRGKKVFNLNSIFVSTDGSGRDWSHPPRRFAQYAIQGAGAAARTLGAKSLNFTEHAFAFIAAGDDEEKGATVSPARSPPFDDAVAAYRGKDYEKALRLFKEIGNQGDAKAQHNVAQMYVVGLGTERNFTEAMAWYRRAADQGDAASQCDLGIMYAEGEGVRPNSKTALMWFHKSAEQGFPEAEVKLAEIAFASRDFGEAFFWWKKAADAGDAKAMFNVASAYYAGRGVPKDKAKAIEYYRKARDNGFSAAGRTLKRLESAN
jgi:uncharacterized protein